jgi:hypothetical protein
VEDAGQVHVLRLLIGVEMGLGYNAPEVLGTQVAKIALFNEKSINRVALLKGDLDVRFCGVLREEVLNFFSGHFLNLGKIRKCADQLPRYAPGKRRQTPFREGGKAKGFEVDFPVKTH